MLVYGKVITGHPANEDEYEVLALSLLVNPISPRKAGRCADNIKM